MSNQADALAKVAELNDTVVDLGVDMQAAFDKLLAQVPPTEDTQPTIDAIQSVIDKLKGFDVTAEGISGQPTPPPTPPTA